MARGEVAPREQSRDMEVSCELVRLDPGWFSLSLGTGSIAGKQGLPAARVSLSAWTRRSAPDHQCQHISRRWLAHR